jgi:hypothetical protein
MDFYNPYKKDIRCHKSSSQFRITYIVFPEGKEMLQEQFQQVVTVKPFRRIRCVGLRFHRSSIKEAHIITQGPAPLVIGDNFC